MPASSPGSLVGCSLKELFAPQDVARLQAIDRMVARTRRPVFDVTYTLTRNGTTTWVRADRWFVDDDRILVVQDEVSSAAADALTVNTRHVRPLSNPYLRARPCCTQIIRQVRVHMVPR